MSLRRTAALALMLPLVGCMGASHHVRYMSSRRAPRAEACTAASLPVHDDRGPDPRAEAFAVITSECRESKEAECRAELVAGGCEAQADALVQVESRLAGGRRRMVGTAVEFVSDATPERSSGGELRAR